MGGHEFPEPIIQHIQSLLTGEEAAQTAIVSKSWHSAWSTRPNLELDDSHFNEIREFPKYAKTTIKRYQHSNLKIESFKLHMNIARYGSADVAERLIAKAKKLGATWLTSHVSITRNAAGFTESWFHELNQFFFQLRQSKIHLSLHVRCSQSFDYIAGNLRFAHKHELESLAIDMTGLPSFSCYALFDGLFRLCRPKLITQLNPCKDWDEYSNHRRGTRKTNNIDFIRHELEQGILVKVSTPTQLMYGLNDLEEVNVQIFDIVDDVPNWRPIPLNSSFDDEHCHRFLLKWKP